MLAFALALTLAAEPEAPVTKPSRVAAEQGAALAPAALPGGSLAFSGFIGAPEVGAGYRQGFSVLEFEAQARFHYLELSGLVEAGVRLLAWKTDRVRLAPTASLGFKFNSGARVFDAFNFGYVALRPRLGLVTSISVSELVQVLVTAEVPWAIALNVTGFQVTPTVGAGVEFQLSSTLSLFALGQGGVDVIKEPLGVAVARPAWGLRVGVGYRLF
ncbi:MAG: hypothetical protein MUC96_29100 [Myxococcaceae bacterium]|jgi:hypothetical protein|nr:hypothetical protein [Myxococcaceae bacterium]